MTAPVVSVVTPVFNAGPVLEHAITSVAAQSFADWEQVLVDDGSTDDITRRILERAAARPNVTVIRTENRGPAAARNLAIARARGRYVLPLDADDFLDATFLARTVPVLEAEQATGVVHTWVGLVDGHVGVWKTGPAVIPALLARCTIHVTSLYRRELWEAAEGYDTSFVDAGEDWDFWIRLAARGVVAREVPEVLAYYRRTPRSRENVARSGTATSDAVVRRMLAKHRALYAAHAPDVIAALYVEVTQLGTSLQRVYANPLVRLALRARALVRRDGA
jgi:glycosyltransferase involved in cell wall biosynthesis